MSNVTKIDPSVVLRQVGDVDNLTVAQWLHDTAERVAKGDYGEIENCIVIVTDTTGDVEGYSQADIRRDQCIGILEMLKLKTAL